MIYVGLSLSLRLTETLVLQDWFRQLKRATGRLRCMKKPEDVVKEDGNNRNVIEPSALAIVVASSEKALQRHNELLHDLT